MESKITISEAVGMRVYYITLISILFGCETNEDHWDNFIDKSKSLGYEVLSIQASEMYCHRFFRPLSKPRLGCPWENGYSERLIRTFKAEEVYLNDYEDITEARACIGHFIT